MSLQPLAGKLLRDGDLFGRHLAGDLHAMSQGRWVATRGCQVRDAIEAAGARLLYLPPYRPDFNPIENAFAKLKALLRKAGERSVEGLWHLIGKLIDAFTPQECANYFAAAGYDPD